jgi:hypothetical protein
MFYYFNILTFIWYVRETDIHPANKVEVMSLY